MKGFFSGSKVVKKPTETKYRYPRCNKCKLLDKCHTPKKGYQGEGAMGILLVVNYPSEVDDERGSLLSDSTGRWVRDHIKGLGYDVDEDCWLVPALACFPRNRKQANDTTISYCRPLLEKAIKELNPRVIITLGELASISVIKPRWNGPMGMYSRWTGHQIPSKKPNAWICPTFLPGMARNEKNAIMEMQFKEQLRSAFELEGRPWKGDERGLSKLIRVELDPNKAARAIRAMDGRSSPVAFDYETNCLKPDHDGAKIVSCSFSWTKNRTIAFPWQGEAIEASKEVILGPTPKIASNLKFEDRWTIKEFGSPVKNWLWDTMLTAHLLDNRPSISSIKFQSYVLLGQEIYDNHIHKFLRTKKGSTFNSITSQIDLKDLLIYNGMDSLLELLVAEKQMKMMGVSKW